MTPGSQRLRDLIRSGAVPIHTPQYNQITLAIYALEREAEGITNVRFVPVCCVCHGSGTHISEACPACNGAGA